MNNIFEYSNKYLGCIVKVRIKVYIMGSVQLLADDDNLRLFYGVT